MDVIGTSSAVIAGTAIIENNSSAGLAVRSSSAALIYSSGLLEVRGSTGKGNGIEVYDNSNLTIHGSLSSESNIGSAGAGIWVERSSNVTLRGNNLSAEIKNNSGAGIWIEQHANVRLGDGTSIHDNSSDGINIRGNSNLKASNIYIEKNSGWGIRADEGSNIDCRNSTIITNGGGDISLDFGAHAKLSGNTFSIPPQITCDSSAMARGDYVCP